MFKKMPQNSKHISQLYTNVNKQKNLSENEYCWKSENLKIVEVTISGFSISLSERSLSKDKKEIVSLTMSDKEQVVYTVFQCGPEVSLETIFLP